MNKQELMTKFNDIWNDYKGSDKYADKVLWAVKELLEKLDEPQKIVLPRDVAEWLDDVAVVYDMFGVFRKFYDKWIDDDRFVMDFVDNHCEGLEDAFRKIARAYLDGYEVDGETKIFMTDDDDTPYLAKETPAEIIAKIKEVQNG